MIIQDLQLKDITPYENNPRHNDHAVSQVAESIKSFGFKVPIVTDSDGIIIAGHTRYKAAQQLGLERVPVIKADWLTPDQAKAWRISDNAVSEIATWDTSMLEHELKELASLEIDMTAFGFETVAEDKPDSNEPQTLAEKIKENPMDSELTETFLIPPFSVIETSSNAWQTRLVQWEQYGVRYDN